jgi:signal transduction histidine kinase/CheY-like chemotaxis protein
MREIMDDLPGVFFEYERRADGISRATFVSAGCEQLLGLHPSVLEHDLEDLLAIVVPEDRDPCREQIARSARELNAVTHDFRITHAVTGELRWLRVTTAVPVRDGRGVRWRGMVVDSTERLRVEGDLQRIKEITEQMPGFVYEFVLQDNLDMGLTFMSGSVEEMVGVPLDDVRRDFRTFIAAVVPEDRGRFMQEILDTVDGRPQYKSIFRIWHARKRQVRWMLAQSIRKHQFLDRAVWFGFVTDMTDQKELEEQLADALVAAQSAERAKSEFLANMSHEIRTPMNAISGMAHLALRTDLDARQRDYLTKIDRSAGNLLGIINDILDFSKIEAGKMTVEEVEFDLTEVLDEVVQICGVRAHEKGLAFHVRIGPDVPRALVGDPLRVGQVLLNFAGNAVKFTQAGRIVVAVSIVSEDEDGVDLHFRVTDTGIGLTGEHLIKLFQGFSQADATTTRRYGGSGLGLVISKNLVELMGGTVGVESAFGEGSSFWATLPFRRAAHLVPRVTSAEPLHDTPVLLVATSAECREGYGEHLAAFGLAVSTAESAADAVERLLAGVWFPLVVLDGSDGAIDGAATLARLRAASPSGPKALVIVDALDGDTEARLRAAGDAAALVKPISASSLFDAIVELLAAGAARPRTEDELLARAHAHLRGARILLAEDNELNQQVVHGLLVDLEVDLGIASDGREAICLMSAAWDAGEPYQAVLMDIQMPVMDGLAATRGLRADTRNAGVPIIAMTANAMGSDRDASLDAGMNDFVTKPIDVGALYATLMKWVPAGISALVLPAPSAEATAPPRALAAVAGIDTRLGLARTGGNAARYVDLLARFRDGQADVPERIEAALADADTELAARLAHTLRGIAGTLGADAVFRAAGELEAAIISADGSREGRLATVRKLLEEAIAGLTEQLPAAAAAPAAAPTAAPANGAPLSRDRALFETLARQIDGFDSAAAETAAALRSALVPAVPDSLTQIQGRLAVFAFGDAAALLPTLRRALAS